MNESRLPYGGMVKVPHFVVTHEAREPITMGGVTFTFLAGGLEQAINAARQAADPKKVSLLGASIDQQCLAAGLFDEIVIHLVPIVLGEGIRLFDHDLCPHTQRSWKSFVLNTWWTHASSDARIDSSTPRFSDFKRFPRRIALPRALSPEIHCLLRLLRCGPPSGEYFYDSARRGQLHPHLTRRAGLSRVTGRAGELIEGQRVGAR